MTLFELQAWLGHRSPESTQHYAQITPTTLAKAYTDAGYFARNVRTIEVLIDREAVRAARRPRASPGSTTTLATATAPTASSSSARTGWPAPAATSTPEAQRQGAAAGGEGGPATACWRSSRSPMERAAVEQDRQAVGKLLDRLADTPTPAGPTPREIAARPSFSPCKILDLI